MRKLYTILEKLNDKQVEVCFQSSYLSGSHYSLKVVDIYGKEHYVHSDKIDDIEKCLVMLWGTLLNSTLPIRVIPSPKLSIPLPPRG